MDGGSGVLKGDGLDAAGEVTPVCKCAVEVGDGAGGGVGGDFGGQASGLASVALKLLAGADCDSKSRVELVSAAAFGVTGTALGTPVSHPARRPAVLAGTTSTKLADEVVTAWTLAAGPVGCGQVENPSSCRHGDLAGSRAATRPYHVS